MQVSETFTTIVRRCAIAFLLFVLIAVVQRNDSHVRAQNAGNIGIYTRELRVLNGVLNGVSDTLPDYGFGASYLKYCPAGWTGAVSFEYAPNGVAGNQYFTLKTALVLIGDAQCRTLQLGGYYPNLRVRATNTVSSGGTVSAYYGALSAPIPYFASATGTFGDTAPIFCDLNDKKTVANGASGFLVGPPNIGGGNLFYTRLCNITISFAATPGAGTIALAWDIDNTCATTPNSNWSLNTTAGTPQVLYFPNLNLNSMPANLQSQQFLCLQNNSGQSVVANYNYALIAGTSQ
jgi:hypothetical protein